MGKEGCPMYSKQRFGPNELEHIKSILNEQLHGIVYDEQQFMQLKQLLNHLEQSMIDDNFVGTFNELQTYISERHKSQSILEHIHLHNENIHRWLEEINNLQQAGPVTLDYEQAKETGL